MQVITTKHGNYKFKRQIFTLGGKWIDKKISKENLLIFKTIMDKYNIPFTLAYGTLLGAIRENDFITHDEDIDIAILREDEEIFLDLLFEFQKNGFVVGRYEDDLLSLIRKNEYIDIYIFKKSMFGLLGYRHRGIKYLKNKYLINTIKYSFLNENFDIPKEYIKYLEDEYGSNWKTPIKNMHGNPGVYLKIKLFLKNNLPYIFKILSWIKRKVK